MSLFQACEWWRAPSDGANDMFDVGSMVVGNADNEAGGHDKIVTGSLQGTLRVFRPANKAHSTATARNNAQSEGKAGETSKEDDDARLSTGLNALSSASIAGVSLLLEERLGAPILQLALGRFCLPPGTAQSASNSVPLSVAILHPNKLLIAFLLPASGPGGGLRLGRAVEHSFAHGGGAFSAANMTVGRPRHGASKAEHTFGAAALDFIAVQSLDGQVAVYEGDRPSFRTPIPGMLLQAPFVHVPGPDTFVMLASDMVLQGYAHMALASARGSSAAAVAGTGSQAPSSSSSTGTQPGSSSSGTAPSGDGGATAVQGVQPAWSINVGEHSNFIMAGNVTRKPGVPAAMSDLSSPSSLSDVVVVGTRTLFVVHGGSEAGTPATTAAALAAQPIRLQKRLDYTAVAACLAPAEGTNSICVCSNKGVLHVYREAHLAWAARLPFVPCAMGVGTYGGQAGMLTLLSPKGQLAVVYMGTEPPAPGSALTGGSKQLSSTSTSLASMEGEYNRLMAALKESEGKAREEGADGQQNDVLLVRPSIPELADGSSPGRPTVCGVRLPDSAPYEATAAITAAGTLSMEVGGDDWERWEDAEEELEERQIGRSPTPNPHVLTLSLALSHKGDGPLRSVTVTVQPPPWAVVPKLLRSVQIPYIPAAGSASSSTPATLVQIPVKARRAGLPTNEPLTLTLSYVPVQQGAGQGAGAGALRLGQEKGGSSSDNLIPTNTGPRVMTLSIPLPLCLAARLIPPVKTATAKLTVDMNRPNAPPLTALFPDMLQQPVGHTPSDDMSRILPTAPSVLSFRYPAGGDCSILASKSGGRLRVQSGTLEGLLPVTAALIARLRAFYGTDPPALTLSLSDPLPLPELGQAIDEHLAARHALAKAQAAVADRAHEYRLVAKRLLVRFKDRSPAPLSGLDALLDAAGEHVQQAAQGVQRAQDELVGKAAKLSATVSLLLLLLPLKHPHLDEAAMTGLRAHLTPSVQDSSEQGWEERSEAALTALVKGGLTGSGSGLSTGASGAGAVMTIPEDSGRLKRVLAVLLDRISKGASPLPLTSQRTW